mmetsp:Transcript_57688/g.101012  ORF Transcript_57688/g.101012 Transcript_57688/m.101012 type:complete len:241 (+) Transcript_57688:62-784(+)
MAPPEKKNGSEKKTPKTGSVEDGLPGIDSLGAVKFFIPTVGALIVPRLIAGAAAVYLYKKDKEKYDKKIAGLEEEDGYLFAAAAVIGLCTSWLNNYPMLYKSMVMRFGSGNLRANMMIYKEAGKADAPYVVLDTEGPVGSYNRANRSLTHFIENSLPTILAIFLAGKLFPYWTFMLTAAFCAGRVLHQIGYSTIGYGAHAPGFAVAMMSATTLEMFCVLIAAKNLGFTTFSFGSLYKLEL